MVTEKAESKSNFAKAAAEKSGKGGKATSGKARSGRSHAWVWILLFAAVLGGVGAWAWYNWPQFKVAVEDTVALLKGGEERGEPATVTARQERDTPPSREAVPEQPRQAPDQPTAPDAGEPGSGSATPPETADTGRNQQAQAVQALQGQLSQQRSELAQLRQQMAQLQRNLASQASRLGELGNVSRTDWQLAEADYLLRLANQRLLLERDSRAALGLLEQVDEILRRVDRPDLYGVRQQLARDITALKMADDIDEQGLYLQLGALQEQMVQASIQPEFDLARQAPDEPGQAGQEEARPAWERSWQNFTGFLKDSVRIRDGSIDPVLLSPQSEARFRQSLRLNMEQAQLAVLRGETQVYRDALKSARQLLVDYGIANQRRDALVRELDELAKQPIKADLPNLNASQRALQDYIEQLHNTSPQPSAEGGKTQ
ncbi:uroporphyrinogen-III C-methyltransferase [Microbulbifer yueqingensis]|uniref:Conserved protein HemX n=1 Tax=Microbulbifer yueqingensis TaxID=658219 RepID=A0A1G9D1N1_9GAMM|nr:uroporphyrinogen-III C-methyltransferase [Microbulbifer yueqingensis]SDK57858.1 conserved protein HemX [Microbulbifer yueqingensis]